VLSFLNEFLVLAGMWGKTGPLLLPQAKLSLCRV
jgi:hypothetical protein